MIKPESRLKEQKQIIIISVLREAWSLICSTHTQKRKKTEIPFAQRCFVPLRKKYLIAVNVLLLCR